MAAVQDTRSRNRESIDELDANVRLVTDSGGDPRGSQLMVVLRRENVVETCRGLLAFCAV
jgi:hypothetical protein